ncbi:hypothetical protein BJ165DRAFT_1531129 [Panaeolus papilionaceus]|nr:hypothetical protein BJ165DRAFT_1531129 [Panaeolus papilionaceus]
MPSCSPSLALDYPQDLLHIILERVWEIALILWAEALHGVEDTPIDLFIRQDFITFCDMLEQLCDGHYALTTDHFIPKLTDNLAQHTHAVLTQAFQHSPIAARYQPVRQAFYHLTTEDQRAVLGDLPEAQVTNFHFMTLAMSRCVDAAPNFIIPLQPLVPAAPLACHPQQIDLTHDN